MTSRTEAYNQAIENLNNAAPKYDELEKLWKKKLSDDLLFIINKEYKKLELSEDQKNQMVAIDLDSYRASLTDESFKNQLNELHKQSVDAAKKQLEFERDNPDQANSQSPDSYENNKEQKTNIETEFIRWIGQRFKSNFEGATNESGDGAKAARILLGISVKDIEKYGILGGENSYLRQIVPTWSDGGGLWGGEGSFFHKNLGLPW
jgi:hypothetical protein